MRQCRPKAVDENYTMPNQLEPPWDEQIAGVSCYSYAPVLHFLFLYLHAPSKVTDRHFHQLSRFIAQSIVDSTSGLQLPSDADDTELASRLEQAGLDSVQVCTEPHKPHVTQCAGWHRLR